MLAIVII